MQCAECGNRISSNVNFCPICGTRIPQEKTLDYIGEYKGRGVWRITFAPFEKEFDDEDSVWDAVRHATWDGETEFDGNPQITFVKSTVPPETYPYICGGCGDAVAKDTNGKCYECGEVNWLKR